MVQKLRAGVLLTAAAAAAATALVSVLPFVRFVYRSVSMHVAIETAAGVIALLAGILVLGRWGSRRRSVDLALLPALLLLVLTNLAFSTAPAVIAASRGVFDTWAPVIGGVLASLAFAVAAYVPDRPLRRPGRATIAVLAGCVALVGLIAVALALLHSSLPHAIEPTLSPESSGRPRVVGNSAILAMQAASALLFAIATVGFLRRSEREHDELMAWLALATTLCAFARVNYFLFPSLYSDFVYTGDVLKLAAYVALLFGAAREIYAYHRDLARAAAFEERRRMARDLHDGLAQELAYIVTEVRRLAGGGDPDAHLRVVGAAERALNESRGAISALTRPIDEPLGSAVAKAAEEVAARTGAHVSCEIDDAVEVPSSTMEPLLRIVREAVTNATRHGHAQRVRIELSRSGRDGFVLRIHDDGCGFEPLAVGNRADAFGIRSMSERSRAIGAELRILSQTGAGASVEVVLP